MSNVIKNYIKELSTLDKKFLQTAQFPLSVTQYDETDVFNSLKTLLKGWPTIGKEVFKVEEKIKSY